MPKPPHRTTDTTARKASTVTARRTPAPLRAIAALFKAIFLTVRAAFALGLGAAILAGLPWALVKFAGWPLPHRVPSLGQLKTDLTSPILGDQFYLNAIAIVLWFLWSILVFSFLLELAYAVRRIPAPHVPGLGPMQLFAGFVITAVGITALLGRAAAPAYAEAGTPAQARPAAAALPTPGAAHLTAAGRATAGATPREAVHHVKTGDSLFTIAAEDLGDGQDWPALYEANVGVVQHDGQRLTNPDLILPGWDITIPGATTAPVTIGPAPSTRAEAPASTGPEAARHIQAPVEAPGAPGGVGTAAAPPKTTPPPAHVASPARRDAPVARPVSGSAEQALWVELAAGGVLAASTVAALARIAARRAAVRGWRASCWWPERGQSPAPVLDELPPALRPARTIALNASAPVDGDGEGFDEELDEFAAPTGSTGENDDLDYETDDGAGLLSESTSRELRAGSASAMSQASDGAIPVAAGGTVRWRLAEYPGGIGLSGPGALGAARAIATAAIANNTPLCTMAQLVIPRADAALLLECGPDEAEMLLAPISDVIVTADLTAAVAVLEAMVLQRTRQLEEFGYTDFTELLAAEPDEIDAETLVLLAVSRPDGIAGLSAVLDARADLRLTAVLLGGHPRTNLRIEADGTVVGTGAGPAGGRAFDLGPAALREAVELVASMDRYAEPEPPFPVPDVDRDLYVPTGVAAELFDTDPTGCRSDVDAPGAGPDQVRLEVVCDLAEQPQDNGGADGLASAENIEAADQTTDEAAVLDALAAPDDDERTGSEGHSGDGPDNPAELDLPDPANDRPASEPNEKPAHLVVVATDAPTQDVDAHEKGREQVAAILARFSGTAARLCVLGRPSIHTARGQAGAGMRTGSWALALKLALHYARGQSFEEMAELWPDLSGDKLAFTRKNDIQALRGTLKHDVRAGIGTGKDAEFVPRQPGGRYRLDPRFVAVDLVCFEELRVLVATSTDPAVRRHAAESALGLYEGELGAGMHEGWLTAPRAAIRRDALATATLLAEMSAADGDDTAALSWWERARQIDDNEEVYRQIMKTQSRLGRRADIIATKTLLETKLESIDQAPDQATRDLLAQLLAERPTLPPIGSHQVA